jgi:hypothetical protein
MCGSHEYSRTGNLEGLTSYLAYYHDSDNNKPSEECLNQCVYIAAKKGHLHIIKYLIEEWNAVPDTDCIRTANDAGHIIIVEYLTQFLALAGDDKSAK